MEAVFEFLDALFAGLGHDKKVWRYDMLLVGDEAVTGCCVWASQECYITAVWMGF